MKIRKKAFSLIEMMMVILIIGILMVGFLMSPILRSIAAAKVRRSEAEKSTIAAAVRNYRYEYGQWPCIGTDTVSVTIFGASPPHMNADIIKCLTNKTTNPKDIRFINTTEYTPDPTNNNLLNPVNLAPYTIIIDAGNDKVSVN